MTCQKLAIFEFVTKNKELPFTKFFLFFVFKDFHSHMSFDILDLFNNSIYEQIYK